MPHQTLELCIRENFRRNDFDVNDLLCIMGLSQSYVQELTYRNYGQSPGELIESVRLDAAIRRLHCNEHLVVLGLWCGFGSVRTFSRVFHKRLSISVLTAKQLLHESVDKQLILQEWQRKIWDRSNGMFTVPSTFLYTEICN